MTQKIVSLTTRAETHCEYVSDQSTHIFDVKFDTERYIPSRFAETVRLLEDEGEGREQKVQDSVYNSFNSVSMDSFASKLTVKVIPM